MNTYKASLVTNAIKDYLELNKNTLGLEAVYYGDQTTFPLVPCVCVEPATTTRELEGANYVTNNTFTINILVYHSNGLEGTETTQEECDVFSEAVQDAVNKEGIHSLVAGGSQFGGLIIHGHVIRLEYGYRILSDRIMRCNRLVWQGRTKTNIVEV